MPHLLPFHDQLKHWALRDDMRGLDCLGCEEVGASWFPAPTLAAVRAGAGTIKVGMKGDSVKTVQGLVGASTDGEFGPATESAVKSAQLARNLPATGVVDQVTMAALDAYPKTPAPLVFEPDVITLKKPATAATTEQSWWTQSAWQGGNLKRWQVGAIGGGATVGLVGLLGWLLSSGAKAVK